MTLRRHVLAFFQGNRYLLRDLVAHVVGLVPSGGTVLDLYAGVGLFSVAAAAIARRRRVPPSKATRRVRAICAPTPRRQRATVTPCTQPVEDVVGARRGAPTPSSSIRREPACRRRRCEGASRCKPPRLIYVSCDVATLARDARKIVDAGYAIDRVDAFDMFPNTPHVETVVVFEETVTSRIFEDLRIWS